MRTSGGDPVGSNIGPLGVGCGWESRRLEILPGCSLPVYAPRIMRSISVSPGRGASNDFDRICEPNTIARCSLSSTLFWYRCKNISAPVTVGIRARTTQSTCGRAWSSFGGFCELVSTGMHRGSRREAGVAVPGVEGGVKAGLMMEFGGSWSRS